jgi:hypothetical protein
MLKEYRNRCQRLLDEGYEGLGHEPYEFEAKEEVEGCGKT